MNKKREKAEKRQYFSIFSRYIALLLAAIPNFWIFYFIFTPLTIYPVYFLLNMLLESVVLSGSIITINNIIPIEIIDACVAGSAYYLLLILNLSVPNIKISKRIKMIFLSFIVLLIFNILRIFFLSMLYVSNSSFFGLIHKMLWYFGSILFIILIWFAEVKFFRIKDIPLYSDIKFLYKLSVKK